MQQLDKDTSMKMTGVKVLRHLRTYQSQTGFLIRVSEIMDDLYFQWIWSTCIWIKMQIGTTLFISYMENTREKFNQRKSFQSVGFVVYITSSGDVTIILQL